MNGLYVKKSNESLDKAKLDAQELNLLASVDGVEVMTQEIIKGVTFDLYPAENNSSMMEFFYVLDGELEYLPKVGVPRLLKSGDYFYLNKLEDTVLFRSLSNVKLLYISTEPIFQYLSESLNELYNINKAFEEKDKYTHGHSERVQDLAVKVALEMRLDRETISKLALAALFHDVGKILVPDEILKKPSKLTDEEYNVIKNHPYDSVSYVKNIKYTDITKIVEQHHERVDGSGYPYGLTDDQICIEAKIIAVVDSYDAMTSNRSYRKAMSDDVAIGELVNLAGVKYDSKVVNAFVKVINNEDVTQVKQTQN